MDSIDELGINPEDIRNLNQQDSAYIQNFLVQKNQEANVQRTVHEFAETCFKKCIKGSIGSGTLNAKENTCMTNCVNRFMDSNLAVLKHLEKLRGLQ